MLTLCQIEIASKVVQGKDGTETLVMDQDKIKIEEQLIKFKNQVKAQVKAHSQQLIKVEKNQLQDNDDLGTTLSTFSHEDLVEYTAKIMETLTVCQIESQTETVKELEDDSNETLTGLEGIKLNEGFPKF